MNDLGVEAGELETPVVEFVQIYAAVGNRVLSDGTINVDPGTSGPGLDASVFRATLEEISID